LKQARAASRISCFLLFLVVVVIAIRLVILELYSRIKF